MGESYRDYFVRRKALVFCGRWEAETIGDPLRRQTSQGHARMVAWENQHLGFTWGHSYPTAMLCYFTPQKGSLWALLQEWRSLPSLLYNSLKRSWRTELNLVLPVSALIFPGIPPPLPNWHLSIGVVQWNFLQWRRHCIQGRAKVGSQLWVCKTQGLFLCYLLILVLFSMQTAINLLLPHPVCAVQYSSH